MGTVRRGVSISLVGGLLAWVGVVSAQEEADESPADTQSAAPPPATTQGQQEESGGTVGGYSWGSTPKGTTGAKTVRRRAPRIKTHYDRDTPIATYPGFQVLPDGTSLVWVTVSRNVPVRVERAGGRATYLLDGAHVQIWNNTNPLVTTHFRTPVASARLRPGEAGARLVVELREDVEPTYQVVSGPRGTMLLQIRVPPSSPSNPPSDEGTDAGNMAATAPDPEPNLAGTGQVKARGDASLDAHASLSLSSKKSKKSKKHKRRRKKHR